MPLLFRFKIRGKGNKISELSQNEAFSPENRKKSIRPQRPGHGLRPRNGQQSGNAGQSGAALHGAASGVGSGERDRSCVRREASGMGPEPELRRASGVRRAASGVGSGERGRSRVGPELRRAGAAPGDWTSGCDPEAAGLRHAGREWAGPGTRTGRKTAPDFPGKEYFRTFTRNPENGRRHRPRGPERHARNDCGRTAGHPDRERPKTETDTR